MTVPRPILAPFEFIGECAILLGDAGRRLFQRPFEGAETVRQMAFVGAASVPIVALTGFFSGGVLALYLAQFLSRYGAERFVGATVGLTMTREVGPVIAGIAVAARCGSAIAAQLGSMTVNEQVDALRMLGVHPTRYLVIPRLIAGILMMPVLSLVCTASGLIGGAIVATVAGIASGTFWRAVSDFGTMSDLLGGMGKAPFFGLAVVTIACQQGLRTRGGAEGVGRSTTNAVVLSMVIVYALNFLLAGLFFGGRR